MRALPVFERALWAVLLGAATYSAFCLYKAGSTRFSAPVYAQQSSADVDGPIVGRMGGGYSSGVAEADGTVIGKVSIPAIRLSVPIVEGLTKEDLLRGVGHVPGSATAGGLGNMALAAHRDTFFRPVRNIKIGMPILVQSTGGTYEYQVDSTEVVSPEQVSVLDIGSVPQLTLITCYPFNYIGAAPQRFIVRAHLVSLLPIDNKP